jgi:hypothetical protein
MRDRHRYRFLVLSNPDPDADNLHWRLGADYCRLPTIFEAAAAAFFPAIWPVHNASALFPPPLYIQPQKEPNSPALYNL